MKIPAHIFKAYDIRGLVGSELSPELAYRIGQAFVIFLRKQKMLSAGRCVVIGRDMRESGLALQKAVIEGVTDAGVDVVDIGLVSTPLFNFSCAHYPEHAGGIMVTASHNPAEYNGFKMTLGNGLPVGKESGMDEIQAWVASSTSVKEPRGSYEKKATLPDYLARLFALVPRERIQPLSLVIDCGNGMADVTFSPLIEQLPVEVHYLYREPDGRFPNHEANPLKVETLRDLEREVLFRGADFGFALDGDADRIGVVDETGTVVDASFVGTLIGLEVLKKYPHAHLLYDLRASATVKEAWEAAGATTEMCMVGHAFIKMMMKKTQAAFASELSLHLYYRDMYGVESSDLSLLYLLTMLSREKKPLSALVAPLKKYAHSGEINFSVEDKDRVLQRVETALAASANSVSHLDGVRMEFADWWFSLRKSNTEPLLRLNLEAKTEKRMREKIDEIRAVLEGK